MKGVIVIHQLLPVITPVYHTHHGIPVDIGMAILIIHPKASIDRIVMSSVPYQIRRTFFFKICYVHYLKILSL